MRRFGPLLLVLLLALAFAVGGFYKNRLEKQAREAPTPPPPLEQKLSAAASGWQWAYSNAGRPVIEVKAAHFAQIREPAVFDLKEVELKIYHQEGQVYDRVTSPQAQFALSEGRLHSDAAVSISMGYPAEGGPPARMLAIEGSGVTFENKTGRADSDQHATFSLDVGEGEADGVTYDPQTRELRLKSNVKLIWRGKYRTGPPMYIEAGELIYKELEQKIYLHHRSKFSRQTLRMEGGPSVMTLEDGNIRLVESVKVKGTDSQPNRTVEYAADELTMILRDGGQMEKIVGFRNASLRSLAATATTRVTSDRIELSFRDEGGSAALGQAVATGKAVAESAPLGLPAAALPETRVLRSEHIEMVMRAGGEEIERLDTHAPGELEFLPNRTGQRRRKLDGERLSIRYGAANQLESFRAVQVKTRTEPAVRGGTVQTTSSQDLLAKFDPKTGEMVEVEQWGDFRYREGDRQARSERGAMEQQKNRIRLSGAARVWDRTGSTDADTIEIDERAGSTHSNGNVRTIREPERAGEERIRGSADEVVTTSNNARIRYQGQAVLWQGENRLSAKAIDIDRPGRLLKATGDVIHVMKEKANGGATEVRAQTMLYRDADKVSFYDGGTRLTQPGLVVKSQKLRGYLREASSEEAEATVPGSSLDRAFAEGAVEIVETRGERNRTGRGDVAEYYAADNRVILEGPAAELVETSPGVQPTVTRGQKLSWSGNTDKLLVDGTPAKPAVSSLRRKKS
jgi:lipopolysaccharide export system protein LptA